MLGWIVLSLLAAGILLFVRSLAGADGTAEERMSGTFIGFLGLALVAAALLILLGKAIWSLF